MQMIKAFNETIRYIESELDGEIDESRVAMLSGYSFAMFSRLFSILTNMTLSEYIRLRKLTKAAVEINETSARIIDIAVKYGYESPDSFTKNAGISVGKRFVKGHFTVKMRKTSISL